MPGPFPHTTTSTLKQKVHFNSADWLARGLISFLHPCLVGKLLTEEQVKKWWKEEMTFDLQSILKSISVYDSTLTWKDFIPENGAKNYGILDIEETSSSLGRCYLFRFFFKFQVKSS